MALLSKRLSCAAELVPEGSVPVDIGTDHAWLPIALCQTKAIPSALAFDVKEGPLCAAREHITEAGLEKRITTRLSDGFQALKKGEADTALILGMGGGLIRRILEEGQPMELGLRTLILGPQSEQKMLRSYLTENGYRIPEERYVFEDDKYYVIMKADFGEEEPYTPEELLFGRQPLRTKNPVFMQYLSHREAVLTKILDSLPGNPAGAARKTEVEDELTLLQKAKEK